MRYKELKRAIAAGLLSASVFSSTLVFQPEISLAAPSSAHLDEVSSDEDPNNIVNRVRRIIEEHNAAGSLRKSNTFTNPDVESSAQSAREPVKQEVHYEQNAQEDNSGKEETDSSISYGKYDFDWQGTPIAQSIYAVAKIANKDVVVNGEISGKCYMSLHGVTCEQAMDYLGRAFGFNWMVEGDIFIISSKDTMLQSKTFKVQNIHDFTKLTEEIKALNIDEDKVYANTESRTVSVTGTPYQLLAAERRLSAIDKPVSQCLILAQLIEVDHGKELNLGMQYSLPTYNHTGTTTGRTTSDSFHGHWGEKLTFSASATANRALSNGKVIYRPMVMVMNGRVGTVNFGDKVPILKSTTTSASTDVTVEYQDVGTTLKIIPGINETSGEILLDIEAEVSAISKWVTSGQTTAPQISIRKAVTSAHLKSGQSFVIGGLMSRQELDNLSGIPLLMNLPILGKLFSYHSKSNTYAEIFIMITPYIVTNDIDPEALMRKAGAKDNG